MLYFRYIRLQWYFHYYIQILFQNLKELIYSHHNLQFPSFCFALPLCTDTEWYLPGTPSHYSQNQPLFPLHYQADHTLLFDFSQ